MRAKRIDATGVHDVEMGADGKVLSDPGAVGGDVVTPSPAVVGTAESLIAEYGDGGIEVHEEVVEGRTFWIRRLDYLSMIDIETQRLTVERNRIIRMPGREAKLGLALELSSTVYVQDGSGGYTPLFTVESIQQLLARPAAIGIVNGLAEAVYRINPSIAPSAKLRADAAASE